MASGRWSRPVARPARKKMSSSDGEEDARRPSMTWPSLPTDVDQVDAVTSAC